MRIIIGEQEYSVIEEFTTTKQDFSLREVTIVGSKGYYFELVLVGIIEGVVVGAFIS